MKRVTDTITVVVAIVVTALAVSGCASGGSAAAPVYSEDSLTLDAAISQAASWFIPRLPEKSKLAVVSIDAPTGIFSDYVLEEFWNQFESSGRFVMVDRRNLGRIDEEISHQLDSGRVDDKLVVSITKQYGAEILVFGQITSLGGEYRLVLYAADVEKASSSQRTFTVRPDQRLASLLSEKLEDQIDRAVADLARPVNDKTTIAIGRIGLSGTDSVSSLSAYLKNGIVSGAQKQSGKFTVADDNESADFAVASRGLTVETPAAGSSIQAVVLGTLSPVDNNAEVSFRLVSVSGNRTVLAQTKFVIPQSEMERRRLSLLPVKDSGLISKAEYDAKQQAVQVYSGKNNRFHFTASPDRLDGVFYEGEYMTMRIYAEKDCYFRIIHVDVNGMSQVIYPRSAADNNFIRAGQTRRIPDNTRYRMGAPYGEEYILAAAYDRPFAPGGGEERFSADSAARGLTVESDGGTRAQLSPLATAKFSYTILPRQ